MRQSVTGKNTSQLMSSYRSLSSEFSHGTKFIKGCPLSRGVGMLSL